MFEPRLGSFFSFIEIYKDFVILSMYVETIMHYRKEYLLAIIIVFCILERKEEIKLYDLQHHETKRNWTRLFC